MLNQGPHAEAGQQTQPRVGLKNPDTKLALIAERAKENPQEQFNSLLHHLTPELVVSSLARMKRSTSAGIDGVKVGQALEHADWLLPKIITSIHQGSYKPPAVRRVYIPKADGSQRPLGVPTVVDRAVQAATVRILEQIYEQDFLNCSFGFRPKLSCHHAVATLGSWIKNYQLHYALEVDLRDFFGSISHEWMMKFLRLRIKDERVLKLIEGWLRAGVLEDGKWHVSDMGTPQGGSISPLLANIYLHYVLDIWWEKKIRPRLKYRARLVRYADDFIILLKNEYEAKEVLTLLRARLAQFGLRVNDDKTHITDVKPRERRGAERRALNFLGFTICYQLNRWGTNFKLTYQTDRRRLARALAAIKARMRQWMHERVQQQAKRINRVLRGHYNYYGLAGNIRRLVKFEYEVRRYWRECLSRRSQNGKMPWEKMNLLLQQYPLLKPRIRLHYQLLDTYIVL